MLLLCLVDPISFLPQCQMSLLYDLPMEYHYRKYLPILLWFLEHHSQIIHLPHPFRFVVELFAWGISIGCSVTMALTVPNPPLITLYPVWILGCSMYAWAAYTRKSFGMIANYLLLVTIDSVGLFRMVYI